MLGKGEAVKIRPRESEIQHNGLVFLRSLGWHVHRRNTGAAHATYRGRERLVRFSEPGASDVWGVIPSQSGRHVEVEFKRPGEKPAFKQVLWLREMNRITGSAFWCDNLDTLERVARHIDAGGQVVYLHTTWRYEGGVHGIGGDFDLEGNP